MASSSYAFKRAKMGPPIYGSDLQGRSRLGPISRLYEKKVGVEEPDLFMSTGGTGYK